MATGICWVYVLRNASGRFYIGLTDDMERRLADHNGGRSKWTSKFGPWEIIWRQGPMTLTEARKLENRLKRQRGGRGFFALTGLPRSSGPAHGAGSRPQGADSNPAPATNFG